MTLFQVWTTSMSTGMADKDRVGIMGWSFGGFISAYTTTNSDRFRAASVGAGVRIGGPMILVATCGGWHAATLGPRRLTIRKSIA